MIQHSISCSVASPNSNGTVHSSQISGKQNQKKKARMMKVILLVASFVWASLAICPQAQSGLTPFSGNAAWNSGNAAVTIASGTNVLMDTSANVSSITINGKLIFSNKAISLFAGWIFVGPTGSLIMGSTETGCAITNKIIVTLTGAPQSVTTSYMTDAFDGTLLGVKGVGVATGATLQIVGDTPTATWTRVATTVVAGSSTISLKTAPGWSVGDEIIIASTDYSRTIPYYNGFPNSINYLMGRGSPDQNERRFITSIAGNIVNIDTPLNFTHWGKDYEVAEVGVLTRKIVIKGDDSSVATQFGGHMMIRKAAAVILEGVEFKYFGQKGLLGRYPIHFHTANDVYGLGFVVRDCSIHDSFQRCITIHQTNGVTLDGNVAFNNSGHCYFLEDGSERGNTLNNNLGVLTSAVPTEDPNYLLNSDTRPSMFWITNPNNTWTNNAAVGATFGYWFSMPAAPTGTSASLYPATDPWVRPRLTPLGVFDSNVAHSNSQNGFHCDDMVTQPREDTELAGFSPLQGPYSDNTYSYNTPNIEAHFTNFISYKNRQYGVWARGGPLRWTNVVVADNQRGFNCPPEPSVLEYSLIIGETDNIGTPQDFEAGRSRPNQWDNAQPVKGWETYDNSGAQYVKSTTFVNFTTNSIRPAGAISGLECAPFLLMSRDRSRDLTLIDSNPIWNSECEYGDAGYGWSFFDVDGSLLGTPSWAVSNNSLMVDSTCVWNAGWNAYNCPVFKQGGYVQTIFNLQSSTASTYGGLYDEDTPNLRTTPRFAIYPFGANYNNKLSAYFGVGATSYGSTGPYWFISANMKARGGYAVRFTEGTATPKVMTLMLASLQPGDWAIYAIPYPADYLPLTIGVAQYSTDYTPMTAVSSLAQLTSRNVYYYDSASSNLYIRYDSAATDFVNHWGFTDINGYDGWTVRIAASCSTCSVPTATHLAIPAALSSSVIYPQEDEYVARLLPLQGTTGSGVAFFYFNPATNVLTYKITHDLSAIVSGITIGAANGAGQPVVTLPYYDAPISYRATLTRSQWIDLLKGNLYVNVKTSQWNIHIQGRIGCVSGCTLPPQASILDPCSAANAGTNPMDIYTNGFPRQYTNVGEWENNTHSYVTSPRLCGNSSIEVVYGNGGFGISLYPALDTTPYTHIQFYAKFAPLTGVNYPIKILFNSGEITLNANGNQRIPPQYIDNLAISDGNWTRVRAPLSYFSADNAQVNFFFWMIDEYDPTRTGVKFYLDSVRFTGPISDQTSAGVNSGDIYRITTPVSGTLTTGGLPPGAPGTPGVPTAPTPGASTGTSSRTPTVPGTPGTPGVSSASTQGSTSMDSLTENAPIGSVASSMEMMSYAVLAALALLSMI